MIPGQKLWIAGGVLAASLMVQWGGYLHAHGQGAPWDPFIGMAFGAMLLGGLHLLPLVFLGELLSVGFADAMKGGLIVEAALVTALWGTAAAFLRRNIDLCLPAQHDLVVLIAVAALAALAEAVAYVLIHYPVSVAPPPDLGAEIARMWVGDMIGVMVITPLILVFRRIPRKPSYRMVVEASLQVLMSAAILAVIVGELNNARLRWFYLLFLPSIWVATRFGLAGAVTSNLVLQTGLGMAFSLLSPDEASVTDYQYRMLALALSTLFLGAAVNQRRQAETSLRAKQDQLARTSRLSVAGEMAAAMAHELNQPLAATLNFTRAAQRLLNQPGADPGKILAAMAGAAAQAERAGAIIRTLRDFIGQGEIDLRPHAPVGLINEAVALARAECSKLGVRVETDLEKGLPSVNVDAVQIQQVLINLIRNAAEAMVAQHRAKQLITVSARRDRNGGLEVEVADTGPGLDADLVERLYFPFTTTKSTGMGLGLSISRNIMEAHGGRLWLGANGPDGCAFRFSLPGGDTGSGEEG